MDNPERLRAVANTDQAVAAIRDSASVWGQYFKVLREQGFNRDEALQLVLQVHILYWQKALSGPATQPPKDNAWRRGKDDG